MRPSMLKALLFTAALVSVVPTIGCQRRVVVVSFNGTRLNGLSEHVDSLVIEGVDPVKQAKEIGGLAQTIGYYDVSTTMITVRYRACAGSDMLAYHEGSGQIVNDEATIDLEPLIDMGDPPACLKARIDAGSTDLDAGGELGGAGGGELGGAGGDANGGAGGGAAGGAGGTSAGGASGADGGTTDSAECGTDTHGPTCDPPSGSPTPDEVPLAPPITPECDQYCNDIQTKCAGVAGLYDSLDSCRRYCVEAGWANADPQNRNNSLSCRTASLAGVTSFNQATNCAIAGPTGHFNCGMPCPDFCAAWIGICNPSASAAEANGCLTACQGLNTSSGGADPTCRFQLLQRALFDTRYCNFVGYTDSCLRCD